MAHFWMQEPLGDWVIFPLDAAAYSLGSACESGIRPLTEGSDEGISDGLLVVQSKPEQGPAGSERERWVLLSNNQRDVYVNGDRLHTGLRVLRDRDELRISADDRYFFSTERLAEVQNYPGGADRSLFCPRCKQEVKENDVAVKCPLCGNWYHESEDTELLCWTYTEICATCPQKTSLSGEFRWCPDEL